MSIFHEKEAIYGHLKPKTYGIYDTYCHLKVYNNNPIEKPIVIGLPWKEPMVLHHYLF